ncbi:MAG: InlB B-repeat-containing protein [Anaeroplasmataceae bacterium]
MKKFMMFLVFILFILSSCNNNDNTKNTKEVIDFEVVSPAANQTSSVDDFNLKSIWLDVTYEDNTVKRVLLDSSMVSKNDLNKLKNPGNVDIFINLGDISKKINIFLYDEGFLDNNKIFLLHSNENTIYCGSSIYEYDIEVPDDYYFYNWYLDEECVKEYEESNEKIVDVYAKFIKEKTYRVRFYHNEILLKEEYVKEGADATPPKVSSYNDYKFIKWDKDYTNITSDIDIYTIYEKGVHEVIFYDYDKNILSKQYILDGNSASPPKLEEKNGNVFIGWSVDFSKVYDDLYIYPIFQNENIKYQVRFFKEEASVKNYLYTEMVYHGQSIEFLYDMPGETIVEFSHSLNNIESNLDIIVKTKKDYYKYYIDGELYKTLLSNEIPEAPSIDINYNLKSYWKMRDDDKTSFDLVYENENPSYIYTVFYYYDSHDELHTQTTMTSRTDIINTGGIDYFYSVHMNEYEFYKWYADKNYTISVTNEDLWKYDIIYGKKVETLVDYDENIINFSLYEDGYRAALNRNNKDILNGDIINIPKYYNGKKVISVEKALLDIATFCFIPDSVIDIYESTEYKRNVNGFIIDSNNSCYYSDFRAIIKKGNKYDEIIDFVHSFYRTAILYNPMYYTIGANVKLKDSLVIEPALAQVIFEEGISEITNLNFTCDNLYLPYSVKKISLRDDSSFYATKVYFESGSSLEYINMTFLEKISIFMIPASVKFIDYKVNHSDLNISINRDNPYLVIKDNFLLTKDEKTFISIISHSDNKTLEIPSTVENIFYGSLENIEYYGYTSINYPPIYKECLGYNGYETYN